MMQKCIDYANLNKFTDVIHVLAYFRSWHAFCKNIWCTRTAIMQKEGNQGVSASMKNKLFLIAVLLSMILAPSYRESGGVAL